MISGKQVRAARALLDWSRGDLSKLTQVSLNTIRNLESGDMSTRITTMNVIQEALENTGIEFTEGNGVRNSNDTIHIFQGPDSCEEFCEDMLLTIKRNKGKIFCVFKSKDLLSRFCRPNYAGSNRLELLSDLTEIKCLLSEAPEPSFDLPSMEIRMILRQQIGACSYFVYGNKHALVLLEDRETFKFVVFHSYGIAEDYKKYFIEQWNLALQFSTKGSC
jgi:transcriptional regulator with XRE-family HTH domain